MSLLSAFLYLKLSSQTAILFLLIQLPSIYPQYPPHWLTHEWLCSLLCTSSRVSPPASIHLLPAGWPFSVTQGKNSQFPTHIKPKMEIAGASCDWTWMIKDGLLFRCGFKRRLFYFDIYANLLPCRESEEKRSMKETICLAQHNDWMQKKKQLFWVCPHWWEIRRPVPIKLTHKNIVSCLVPGTLPVLMFKYAKQLLAF